jgi:nitrous oxidase accessory protein
MWEAVVRRVRLVSFGIALASAALVGLSTVLPLWTLTMKAPQYPKGLRLEAYGTTMVGDLRELNILNHYIGMQPIAMPPLETALFPIGILALVTMCLAAPLHRYLRRLATAALAFTPLVILADLQRWLYVFGHSLDPHAPIRLKPFTPLVLGTSSMGNFQSSAMAGTGMLCLLAAAILLALSDRIARRFEDRVNAALVPRRAAMAAAMLLLLGGVADPVSTAPAAPKLGYSTVTSGSGLQQRLLAAAPGQTIAVDGGIHQGPIVIRGPLTVVGTNHPVIDGNGVGSVVTIEGTDVVFGGFVVRNSGRNVTEEAAGIAVTGDRHRIEANEVQDVYFGIHIAGGTGHVVENNVIAPGEKHGARPGHGISVWHVRDAQLHRNRISEARDGIYLSFTDGVLVSDNEISRCRYGVHSMYSQNAAFDRNRLTSNLLGAALMMSDRLVLSGNRIEQHREGAAAYGVLLKDIGDLRAEGNRILANRVGIYAEAVRSQPGRQAIVSRNVIAGNEVGLALQSNAALTVTGNVIADNLADVRALGRQLSPSMQWSLGNRGNSWSQYRGYDADRDGIGDVPYRVDGAMDALVGRQPMVQALLYTPAHLAVEAAARMFPLFRQKPLLTDEHPLMHVPVDLPPKGGRHTTEGSHATEALLEPSGPSLFVASAFRRKTDRGSR